MPMPPEKTTIPGQANEVLVGNELAHLPWVRKLQLATQISDILKEHTDTMLGYEPEQLIEFMDKGLAVIALGDHDLDKLAAFGRLHPWEGKNERCQTVFEFRTWISTKKGNGINVLKKAVGLGKLIDADPQIIAIVEAHNDRANQVFTKFGGTKIYRPGNVSIVLNDGQAEVNCYDLTNIDTTDGTNIK